MKSTFHFSPYFSKQFVLIFLLQTILFLYGFVFPPVVCAEETVSTEKIQVWKHLKTTDAVSVRQEWKPTQDGLSITGRPIRINGQKFTKGLGTHAPGEIIYDLAGKHTVFHTFAGVDDAADDTGTVEFSVLLDGKIAYESGVMKFGDPAKEIQLDVSGVKELKLICGNAGDGVRGDHADWADAAVDDSLQLIPKPVPQFSTAGFLPVENSQRIVYSFNPGWRFHKGDVAGAEKTDFDDSQWEAANLPHGLEILGENQSGCRNYQGQAWYRKVFEIPATSSNKNVILYFEAVMGKSKVFFDGQLLAEHFGGYLPFAVDISKFAQNHHGEKHLIAVWCDNSDDDSFPPGKPQDQLDFTYLGGIYRDVYWIETNPVHISLPELSPAVAGGGVFVGVADAHDNSAKIEVRTEIVITDTKKTFSSGILRTVIEDADGKIVAEKKSRFSALPSQILVQNFELDSVRLWYPDAPYLHYIRTEIIDADAQVLDSLKTRFGIRLFEMRGDDGFFVNRQFIGHKLSGVNRHQDYAVVGNALPNSGQWRDAKMLREGGSTIIRAAHYPLDPAFMDACDELGLLVTVANPGWQFYNEKNPEFWKRCAADTRCMARRDRNHPSVILWETALNETDNVPIEMLQEMHAVLHDEIPFPGVFSCTDHKQAKPAGFDFSYHAGMNEPVNSLTREYGDGGEVDNFFSQNAATRIKREWGEQAQINQAMFRYRDLPLIYNTPPKRIGATLWCGIDHQRGYHPDPFWGGLLDPFRIPKYSYYVFKSQYDPDFVLPGIETGAMVYIANELTQISPKDVLVMTNCEEVRLTWLGDVVGTQKPDENYKPMTHPPVIFKDVFDFNTIKSKWGKRLDEAEMVAEGLIGGKAVCVQKKKYPQRSTRLELQADYQGVGLTADGGDFVTVHATVIDGRGTQKVLASESVLFFVDGAGELIGGMNPVKTQFGIATALIRASSKSGLIRVRAFSDGLYPADELIIPTAAPAIPLLFDSVYADASKSPSSKFSVQKVFVHLNDSTGTPSEVQTLSEENRRLKQEAVAREQELMELRNKN